MSESEMVATVTRTAERVEDHGRRLAALESCNERLLAMMGEVREALAVISANLTHLHAPQNCPLLARINSTEAGVARCGERIERLEDSVEEVKDTIRVYEGQARLVKWALVTFGGAIAAALWKAFEAG